MQCLKSQTFSDTCARNRRDLVAKIVKHIDGTYCGELCCYKHWALNSRIPQFRAIFPKKFSKELQHFRFFFHIFFFNFFFFNFFFQFFSDAQKFKKLSDLRIDSSSQNL